MTRVLVALLLSRSDENCRGRTEFRCESNTDWRAQHEREILQEFSDLLAIPNLASDTPNIQRNADSDSRHVREARPNDAVAEP